MKNNGNTYRKEKHPKNILIIGTVLLCYMLYVGGVVLFNRIRLMKYGEKKNAVITKVVKYDGTEGFFINYEFVVDGKKIIHKSVPVSEKMNLGDSVSVIYLPQKPEINRLTE